MSGEPAAPDHLRAKPIAAGALVGLMASLCCGGSLIFASIGLGAFHSAFGLSRYALQALAAGAVSIVGINYLYYRNMAKRACGSPHPIRRKMFISAAIGLAVMDGSLIFIEWLNHAVVHADRFLANPVYSQGLITGVPNVTLLYVGATFFALAVLWALPFPGHDFSTRAWMKPILRIAVLGAATILVFAVLLDAAGQRPGGRGNDRDPDGRRPAAALE